MPTPFPGMDPYLEHPATWRGVHNSLIVVLAHDLAPRLRPRYFVAVEERTYVVKHFDLTFVGRPDAAVLRARDAAACYQVAGQMTGSGTAVVELPIPDEVRETYLEVRAVDSDRVVTVCCTSCTIEAATICASTTAAGRSPRWMATMPPGWIGCCERQAYAKGSVKK